jgi:hypothetical protein
MTLMAKTNTYAIKNHTHKNTTKILLAIIGLLLIVGTTALLWNHYHKPIKKAPSGSSSNINFNPPTKQETQETDQHKAQLEQQANNAQNNTSAGAGSKTVTPVIASWGQNPDKSLSITAFVPEVYEDGGTCTLSLSVGNKTLTKTSTAHKDINRTSCDAFTFAYSEISSGTWNASVQYSSPSASGQSNKQAITVN